MDEFLKAAAAVLISTILCIALSKHEKYFSVLISLLVCCMLVAGAVSFLKPVLSFIDRLTDMAQLNESLLQILFKATGVALLAEITGLICKDGGNDSAGKVLQLLASAVILWLSLPLLNELIDLIETILGST